MSQAVMIDLETLGPSPDGAICSIGAAAFDYDNTIQGTFYVNTTSDGRKIDEKTVRWWLGQTKEAQEALLTPPPVTLKEGLGQLKQFIMERTPQHVWANGVTFDLAILRDVWGGYPPWGYKQEMCMRPIRVMGEALVLPWHAFKWSENAVRHNAMSDAVEQAHYVCAVMERAKARWGAKG